MKSSDGFRFAAQALRQNKLRSSLTTLGMIFGVASVIVMVAIGTGTQKRIAEEIDRLGSNLFVVMPGAGVAAGARMGSGSRPTITDKDAIVLRTEVPDVVNAAPVVQGAVHVVAESENWSTALLGVTPEYFETRDWSVGDGRAIDGEDLRGTSKVALIGQTLAEELFGDRGAGVGETIRINHLPFTVIGLLDHKGQTLSGADLDDVVMVPLTTARNHLTGRSRANVGSVSNILVRVMDADRVDAAIEEAKDVLRWAHRLREGQPDDFQIRNMVETLQVKEASSSALTQLLAAVASVSLLVGGIGIMNIMLVSVSERTREIGVRLAIGAKPKHVRSQFMVEAFLLAAGGGIAGILVGIGGTWFAQHELAMRVDLTVSPVVMAFGFAALVGLTFGFYPAAKAARMSPIEALRHD